MKQPKFWIGAGIALVLIGLGFFGYFQYTKVSSELSALRMSTINTQEAAAESTQLTEEVGKLMMLPEENPTVATVTDAEKLKNQPFFIRAENGDKVLIYDNAKKAILYRPSAKKIIDVAPINIGNRDPEATGSAATKTYSVTLRNGSSTVGLTRQYDPILKEKTPELVVSDRQNASRKDFEKTFLVDVKGDKNAIAKDIAASLGISLNVLPEGEASASSDFLIMLGADFAASVASPSATGQ